MSAIKPLDRSEWIEIERPFPAFALSIPEAADVQASYPIRRHAEGGGRKDILQLGEPDSAAPYLRVEIYRPSGEIRHFADPKAEIIAGADALGPLEVRRGDETLASKFGPLAIVSFATSKGTPRNCLGFVRAYREPRLQLSGWFCRGGAAFIEQGTLACALDRLTLLAAGSEPKVGALFAQAELNRSYCGQRDPTLAATPNIILARAWRGHAPASPIEKRNSANPALRTDANKTPPATATRSSRSSRSSRSRWRKKHARSERHAASVRLRGPIRTDSRWQSITSARTSRWRRRFQLKLVINIYNFQSIY